jgi:hypothetical protein
MTTITPVRCTPRSFPDGAKECRLCGACAAAGEELICRKTGLAAVEIEQPRMQATGTHD